MSDRHAMSARNWRHMHMSPNVADMLAKSLICFDENADGGWKDGCTIVHGFCVGSIWFEMFKWRYYGRWGCAIKVLT